MLEQLMLMLEQLVEHLHLEEVNFGFFAIWLASAFVFAWILVYVWNGVYERWQRNREG